MKNRFAEIFSITLLTIAVSVGIQAQTASSDRNDANNSTTSTQSNPKLISVGMRSGEDAAAESLLLELANQRRKEAGVPPLHAEDGLLLAARVHARIMADKQQLSHQFEGEPSLMPRLRVSGLQLSWVAENVALHASVEQAFDALMKSPPHRQNLLDPDYNAAGMAAIWSGGRIYVVQDFARVMPKVMPASTK